MGNNYCSLCGCEIKHSQDNLCEECHEKHGLSLILKNLLELNKDKLNFKPIDLINSGASKENIGNIVWKLMKLNLIKSHNKKLFINDKQLVDEFIDKYNDLSSINKLEVDQFEVNLDKISYEKDIFNILENMEFIEESIDVPFPQANNLNKFIYICMALFERDLTKYDINQICPCNERIIYIYVNVGFYFDIFKRYKKDNKIFYKLNIKGKSIFELDEYNRNIGICHCILEHEIFYRIFNLCLEKNEIKFDSIMEIMKNYDLKLNSEVTLKRRASCVSSWMHWIFKLMYPDKNFK